MLRPPQLAACGSAAPHRRTDFSDSPQLAADFSSISAFATNFQQLSSFSVNFSIFFSLNVISFPEETKSECIAYDFCYNCSIVAHKLSIEDIRNFLMRFFKIFHNFFSIEKIC